jgi:hypothetical protein
MLNSQWFEKVLSSCLLNLLNLTYSFRQFPPIPCSVHRLHAKAPVQYLQSRDSIPLFPEYISTEQGLILCGRCIWTLHSKNTGTEELSCHVAVTKLRDTCWLGGRERISRKGSEHA